MHRGPWFSYAPLDSLPPLHANTHEDMHAHTTHIYKHTTTHTSKHTNTRTNHTHTHTHTHTHNRPPLPRQGIVSCLAFNPPACDMLAAGTYSGAIGLFDARCPAQQLLLLEGHSGGVTQARHGGDGGWGGPARQGSIPGGGCGAAGQAAPAPRAPLLGSPYPNQD
jgi:hypothetical protein